jgi:hypothetical protein
MFIAILSVKLKVKSYVQIHGIATQHWDKIIAGLDLKLISKRQLRDRSKKYLPPSSKANPPEADLSFSYFLNLSRTRVISADKMMNRAKGPKWHKKQKDKGIIPKNLIGIDKQATWCKSNADDWVYGHVNGTKQFTSNKHIDSITLQ